MNKVILIGNLGSDPELRHTDGGHTKCSLSLATNRRWTNKDSGEKMEETTWHRCIAWGKQAEILAQYLTKGRRVCLEGRIRNYVVGEGDDKKYFSEIVVENFEFLGGNGEGNGQPKEQQGGDEPPPF